MQIQEYQWLAQSNLVKLQAGKVIDRIWQRDHSLWAEYAGHSGYIDRLGWLDIPERRGQNSKTILNSISTLNGVFPSKAFRSIVVIGMGGSGVGAGILYATLGVQDQRRDIFTMDLPLPQHILGMDGILNLDETAFVISSKSGTTPETWAMMDHYWDKVPNGRQFMAITENNSPLHHEAKARNFAASFQWPADISGRFSILQCPGILPAGIAGIPVESILARAREMRQDCIDSSPDTNPGAMLAAVLTAFARQGRDKVTFLTHPQLTTFQGWLEQLLAESLGKRGSGVIPVADETVLDNADYGDDRLFVYLSLPVDDYTDRIAQRISSSHPIIELKLRDIYDIGAQIFLWQFATAVAGHILSINPFDEPAVESVKNATRTFLLQHRQSGEVQSQPVDQSLTPLLSHVKPGDYVAVTAYVSPTMENDVALDRLRATISAKHKVPVTLGYGPRYLHSTGQMHKDGPGQAHFIQLTQDHPDDIEVPREDFTFGNLVDCQAAADAATLVSQGKAVARFHLSATQADQDINALSKSV